MHYARNSTTNSVSHTRAHLGMFGLFEASLWFAQASPIMDLKLKHSCVMVDYKSL